jgi:ubiquinone biosynthesis protein UbiJ
VTNASLAINLLLAGIEEGIRKTLAMDSGTRQKLARLNDFVLQLTIKGLDISFFVIVHHGNVSLASYNERSVDCSLACYPTQLLNLIGTSADGKPMLDPGVKVEGNRDLLLELHEIFRKAEPDYEAELARWLGPVAGHQAGRSLRSGARWFRNSAGSLAANLKLYIQEEAGLFPHPLEVEQFYQEVSELELKVAELAIKLEPLIISRRGESTRNGQGNTQGDES